MTTSLSTPSPVACPISYLSAHTATTAVRLRICQSLKMRYDTAWRREYLSLHSNWGYKQVVSETIHHRFSSISSSDMAERKPRMRMNQSRRLPRRGKKTQKGLPSLPTELLLQILDLIFEDAPRNTYTRDLGYRGDWKPLPILQVCQSVRKVGLEEFLKYTICFSIHDYDMDRVIRFCSWRSEVMNDYFIKYYAPPYVCIGGTNMRDKRLESRLWHWIEEFWASDLPIMFMEKDYDETTMGNHTKVTRAYDRQNLTL